MDRAQASLEHGSSSSRAAGQPSVNLPPRRRQPSIFKLGERPNNAAHCHLAAQTADFTLEERREPFSRPLRAHTPEMVEQQREYYR
ncbi:hypothetical protein NECAME_00461 [Necator americanus]|uniref:Uncharacterized protein n=1 Tax=Necator americanus TaxID=51031 RepID=W2T6Z3_NECAM|nr:hypothetical protein NECAME_00461 [Necator americanus]ETN76936.1 hypothetical protein NECAME_00461 [Necator americanus]